MLKNKKELPEIIVPTLYNTYEKPKEPNNYSVWINREPKNFQCSVYINGKWFEIFIIKQDELKAEDIKAEDINAQNEYVIDEKDYKFLKAIKDYLS